jgi:8-oxo-dGTP pyrophosphatase MutT (NUDIX family)
VLIGIVTHPEPTVIFTRRTEALTHHAGQISFPGGRLEAGDEGPVAAALRETEEEIGLPPSAVTPLGFLDPYATITGFRVIPVVATVAPGCTYRMEPREVAEVFETPLSAVLDPGAIEQREREWRGRMRRYHVLPWQGRDIWGATAAMIVNLRERLQRAEAA